MRTPATEFRGLVWLVAVASALFLASGPAVADGLVVSNDAREESTASLTIRYRYENVDEDSREEDAQASTLRTIVNYRTKPRKGFSLFVEAEDVTVVGDEGLFNNKGAGSLSNGVTDRPVVADPELTEINQAYLQLERGKALVKAGRFEILRGDTRFVGNVGWRQNHQSFDALTIEARPSQRVTWHYSFIHNVNRIFGDDKRMRTHLSDLAIGLGGSSKATLYWYLLDFDEVADFQLSTSTYGLEIKGSAATGKFLYEAEFARQVEHGDNPMEIEAGYYNVSLGIKPGSVTLRGGLEVLEGDPQTGRFATPLATLHKFNGWADKFLATPPAGLEDLSAQIGGSHGALSWKAIYHVFSANDGDEDYGTEADVLFSYKTRRGQVLGAKGAIYDADTFSSDTTKIWIWTQYSF